MKNLFSGEHFYDEAKSAKNRFPAIVTLLIFFILFWVSQSAMSVPIMLVELPMAMEHFSALGESPTFETLMSFFTSPPAEYAETGTIIQLFATIIPAAIAIIFCRFAEGRSLRSMGFVKEKALPKYLLGLAAGMVMFSAVLLLAVVTGNASFGGIGVISSPLMYALICVGWLLQGAEEEIICRGWLMTSLSIKLPMWAAVIINSAFFSVMHLFNAGFNFLAALNILLVGIMLSLFAVRFNNIWISCAIHSVWNWVQGNFYGLPVSGMATGSSVLNFELTGSELWTGGSFGLESGLGATIVCAVVILLLIFVPQKKKGVGNPTSAQAA